MPTTYLAPGVYVEEIAGGSRPIEGVGTSIAAFIGFTERVDPENPSRPVRVTNWTQYQEKFGGFTRDSYLPASVYGFFANGGGNCWIVPIGTAEDSDGGGVRFRFNPTGGVAQIEAPAGTALQAASAGPFKITAVAKGHGGNDITVQVKHDDQGEGTTPAEATAGEGAPSGEGESTTPSPARGRATQPAQERFSVTVSTALGEVETYPNLTVTSFVREVNRDSKLIRVEEPSGTARRPDAGSFSLEGGQDGPSADALRGNLRERRGLEGLSALEDATMVVMPDLMKMWEVGLLDRDGVISVQKLMLAHCANMGNRVAILDVPPWKIDDEGNLKPRPEGSAEPEPLDATDVLTWKKNIANLISDDGYGVLYYPWVKATNPATGRTTWMPPSGHIAGLWSRVDDNRGVHKAPANEELRGVLDVTYNVTHGELETLNPNSVNCIRNFPGRGIRVWGGRTLAEAASEWRYLNVRRLTNYLKASIEGGTQWVVFEPNDQFLWGQVTRDVTAFMRRVWATGALFGTTPAEAFYVKCDRETNPQENIDAGMLVCEIGYAPVKPAEFVIFRLRQIAPGGGA